MNQIKEKFWKAVLEEEDDYAKTGSVGKLPPGDHLSQVRRGIRSKLTDAEAQAEAVMDVPSCIKRILGLQSEAPTEQEQLDAKRVKESLIAGRMAAALEESSHANAWMNREEIQQRRRILGIPGITSARIHKMPRTKLEKLPINKKGETLKRCLLSILIGESAEDVLVVDEEAKGATARKYRSNGKA